MCSLLATGPISLKLGTAITYSNIQCHASDDPFIDSQKSKHASFHNTDEAAIMTDLEETSPQRKTHNWLPTQLKWQWMMAFILYGLLCLLAIIIIHGLSRHNNGLMCDHASARVQFSWRFLPTLVAVSFGLIQTMVFDAVRSTEVFARLSKGGSSTATISRPAGSLWADLIDSFPSKKNDHRFSPAMLCAVLAYMLGFLVVTPLSAALLSPGEVLFKDGITMLSPAVGQVSSIQPTLHNKEYFQIMGNALQNVNTSAWITDQYTVLPFWPLGVPRPDGPSVKASAISWNALTSVYQSSLDCEDLVMKGSVVELNLTSFHGEDKQLNSTKRLASSVLKSQSGCEYGFSFDYNGGNYDLRDAVVHWSSINSISLDGFLGGVSSFKLQDQSLILNNSKSCDGSNVFVAIRARSPEAYNTPLQDRKVGVAGMICRSQYYQAIVPVTVSMADNGTSFNFDEREFVRTRSSMTSDIFNTAAFTNSFFSSSWGNYLNQVQGDKYRKVPFGGPVVVLAAKNNFSTVDMLSHPDLTSRLALIQQRALGEALQGQFQKLQTRNINGLITRRSRRIIVVQTVAVILEVVIFLILCLFLGTLYSTRLDRRPLGVDHDVAYIDTVASLVSHDTRSLHRIATSLRSENVHTLHNVVFSIRRGRLEVRNLHKMTTQADKASQKETLRLKAVSLWSIGALLSLLCSTLIVITVLYHFARHNQLNQKAFLYEADLKFTENLVGKFAPHSILPTLLAVIIGLWWGSLEGVFKSAQPLIAMSKKPVARSESTKLSYQSSYLAWATTKAVKHRHWLLALICTGALLSQVCKSDLF